MPLRIAGFRLSSPHSSRQEGSRIHMDKKTTEMLLNLNRYLQEFVASNRLSPR